MISIVLYEDCFNSEDVAVFCDTTTHFEVVTLDSGAVAIRRSLNLHISVAAFSFETLGIKPGGPLSHFCESLN